MLRGGVLQDSGALQSGLQHRLAELRVGIKLGSRLRLQVIFSPPACKCRLHENGMQTEALHLCMHSILIRLISAFHWDFGGLDDLFKFLVKFSHYLSISERKLEMKALLDCIKIGKTDRNAEKRKILCFISLFFS